MKVKYWVLGVLGFLISAFPLILYIIKLGSSKVSSDLNIWNMFGQYLGGTAGPLIALLTLGVTAWIAIEFNDYQKRQTTIELFKEFRSTYLFNAREKAWEVKINWNDSTKKEYRQGFINAMIGETQSCVGGISITKEQIQGVYDLLSFYSMLSTYKHEGKTMNQLNYFYYAWWRKFLFEVAKLYDDEREQHINEEITKHRLAKFNSNDFLNSIKYIPKLKELDKICGLSPLDKDDKPYDIYIYKS